MESSLKPEFEYYLEHQDEFVRQYDGKFIVIKHLEVIGVFDSQEQAISETQKHHELGTFLVQKVEPGHDAYSQAFHSRVTFG